MRHFNWQENSGKSDIHLVDVQSHRDWIVVRDLKSADSIQFANSPRGERLFYVGLPAGDRYKDAKPQVWSVDFAGAAPQQVTEVEAGVANLKVSPQGTHIAFTTDVKMDATVGELYDDLPQADARIIDSLMYRHWNEWHDYAYSHLHVARLSPQGKAEASVDLMRGIRAHCPLPPSGGAEQYDWSPDGTEIAYTAKVVNNPAESTDSDIYVVRLDGQQPDRMYHALHEWVRHGSGLFARRPVHCVSLDAACRDLKRTRTASCSTIAPTGRCVS